MLKKVLWALPILALGIVIGGLAIPNVFAAKGSQPNDDVNGYSQMMNSALNSPQGQQMIQSCEGFMSQYSQNE